MLLLGVADGRRTRLLQDACDGRQVSLNVFDWSRALAHHNGIDEFIAMAANMNGGWCKIDSPGDDEAIHGQLIQLGSRMGNDAGPSPAPLEHGECANQHLLFAGMANVLQRIRDGLSVVAPQVKLLNSVDDILAMTDKWECQIRLRRSGVATPALLAPVVSFQEFEAAFTARNFPKVFIKARYGSSASGIVALHRHVDGRMVAYSSSKFHANGKVFNHLRITKYSDREQISALINAIAAQGAYAEQWIPKPRFPGERDASYDMRVVAFCGAARQRVARVSRTPMTNLHLGNRRAGLHWLDENQMTILESTVAAATRAFPNSHSIGFDVALVNGAACVLEANAFGDLLPGLEFGGSSTYQDQAEMFGRVRVNERKKSNDNLVGATL